MPNAASNDPPAEKFATRGRGKLLALFAATVVGLVLCYRLVEPFLPAVVWAITLAVVTRGLKRRLAAHVPSPTRTAVLCVSIVSIALLAPVAMVGYVAVQQTAATIKHWSQPETQEAWSRWLDDHEWLDAAWDRVAREFDLQDGAPQILQQLPARAVTAASAPIAIAVQTALMLFVLFYLYRDEPQALTAVRRLMPLSNAETDDLFGRLVDTVDATVYGKFAVALLQGVLMGGMFWLVGVAGAVMWGAIMAMLAVIPYLGTFVIWAPVAAAFAVDGEWLKAAMLAAWGAAVVGTVDNLVYPMLVHEQLRQHTVLALLAILGGLAVFGATGLVLGPLTMTATMFLLDVWRRRTEGGRAADR